MITLYELFFVLVGLFLGIAVGVGGHAYAIKRFLLKNMVKHPEYKMFYELLYGNNQKKQEENQKDKDTDN